MNIKQIIISSTVILLIDFLYLYKLNFGSPYVNQIKKIQKSDVKLNYIYAMITYALIIYGLNYFVLKQQKEKKHILIDAFIFGVVTYGIYDFTNATLFRTWDIRLSIQDVLYGGFLMAAATYIALF